MPEKKLREALSDLESQLDGDTPLDDEELALLGRLHDRIERVLEMTGEAAVAERAAAHADVDSSAQAFAVRYPRLASTLERIAETLAGLGI